MWQPISTAPQDGTRVILYDKQRDLAVSGRWHTEPEINNPIMGYEPGWAWWVSDEDIIMWDSGPEDAPDLWMPFPTVDTSATDPR